MAESGKRPAGVSSMTRARSCGERRSSGNRIHAFADILYHAGFATPIRTPRGEDIMAACGQLKSATEKQRKSALKDKASVG
jgi:23S rRNA (adenine2503-C2)-methyltransferase